MFGASASASAPTGGHYFGFVMPSVFDVSGSARRRRAAEIYKIRLEQLSAAEQRGSGWTGARSALRARSLLVGLFDA